jgi:UDP-glucose pyrophosphorylase
MSEYKRPTKAIIPAAGFGTRFLPQTKAMPKEMLPLIDKPIIQYVVEELVDAGIEDIIIVGSSAKRSIEDHFDMPREDLIANLMAGGEKKKQYLDQAVALASMANFIYVRQKGPYGNATPLLSAAHIIGDDETFIYKFADDFFTPEANSTEQLIQTYLEYGVGVFACKTAESADEYGRYGFVAGKQVDDHSMLMSSIVEKPGSKEASPSDLASVSNYLLPSKLLKYIVEAAKGHAESDGEFMFQPLVQKMIDQGDKFYAREIVGGKFYDTGNPLEYLKTTIDFGLKHPEYGPELRKYIAEQLSK